MKFERLNPMPMSHATMYSVDRANNISSFGDRVELPVFDYLIPRAPFLVSFLTNLITQETNVTTR